MPRCGPGGELRTFLIDIIASKTAMLRLTSRRYRLGRPSHPPSFREHPERYSNSKGDHCGIDAQRRRDGHRSHIRGKRRQIQHGEEHVARRPKCAQQFDAAFSTIEPCGLKAPPACPGLASIARLHAPTRGEPEAAARTARRHSTLLPRCGAPIPRSSLPACTIHRPTPATNR